METDEILTNSLELMRDKVSCVFATVDKTGMPHLRMMQTLCTEDDGTVYFSTARDSNKAKHIASNNRLSLLYTSFCGDMNEWECVALTGTAKVTDDKALRERFWVDDFTVYYPEGIDDPGYVIVVFKAEEIHYSYAGAMKEFVIRFEHKQSP